MPRFVDVMAVFRYHQLYVRRVNGGDNARIAKDREGTRVSVATY